MERTYPLPRAERRVAGLGAVLAPLAVMIVALIPRLLDLGLFATMDEVNFWFMRSELFLSAMRAGNFAATAITDHPGVPTMWLGAASLVLRENLGLFGVHALSPQMFVALYELPITTVNALAVGVGYLLMRDLLPGPVALLGALLWALDPFVIAFARVLHVDALSGTFMMLSVLAACRYWFLTRRRRTLALSAVFAALAITTKSPGLILLPLLGSIGVFATWYGPQPRRFTRLLMDALLWAGVAVLSALLIWPALWAAPREAFYQIWLGYHAEGTQPHQLGNFYLGRPEPAPGFTFYPLALALRLTPISFIGLLALPWAWRRLPLTADARHALAGLAWFAITFTLAMGLFAKKFNRYLVPAFPAVDVLAAVGLVWLCAAVLGWFVRPRERGERWHPLALGVVALGAALNVASWQPYQMVAYNQLLGGAQVGAWAFKTGWGEGMNLVADWLNKQPNITGVLTVTTLKIGLQTYLVPGAQSLTPPEGPLPAQSGYVVVYVNDAQGVLFRPFTDFYGKAEPLEVIRLHGVPYAWIYEAPPTVGRQEDVAFGDAARLYGVTSPQQPAVGQPLLWRLAWQRSANIPAGTMLFAHLIGPDGQRYGQIDLPYPPDGSNPARFQQMELPLATPANAPPGSYRLLVGLYTPDGQRLPPSANAADPALDGPNVLVVDQIELAGP